MGGHGTERKRENGWAWRPQAGDNGLNKCDAPSLYAELLRPYRAAQPTPSYSIHAALEVARRDALRGKHVDGAAPAGKAIAVDAGEQALSDDLKKVVRLQVGPVMVGRGAWR